MADEGRIIDQKSPEELGLETGGARNYAAVNENNMVLPSENDGNPSQDTGKFSWSWIYDVFLYFKRSYLRLFTEDEFTDPNMIPNVLYTAANKTEVRNSTTVTFLEDGTAVDATTTLSGNLTFDFTDAKNGVMVVIRHNSPSEPTYSQQPNFIGGNGYVEGVNNLIFLRYVNDGVGDIVYGWITQENASPQAVGGTVDGHIHANLALLETITPEMLLTQEQRDKIASIVPGYVGFYATPVELNTAYPTPTANQFAKVNSTNTIWIESSGAWVDSGGNDATVVLDATQVKTLYESNADTNVFTDAEKAKLASLSPIPPSSGGGGLTLVDSITLASPSASIDFTGLDTNTDLSEEESYYIILQGKVSSGSNRSLFMRFNNDSATSSYINRNSSSQTIGYLIPNCTVNATSAANQSSCYIKIPNPKIRPTFLVSVDSYESSPNLYTTYNQHPSHGVNAFLNAANITDINLYVTGATFLTGTKAFLYKGVL